jgi:hypothetical protein
MFDTNQTKYDQLQKAVQKNWPQITNEEFSRTFGDIEKVVELVAAHSGQNRREILHVISDSIDKGDLDQSFKETPGGVVDSSESESQEWNARTDTNLGNKESDQDRIS